MLRDALAANPHLKIILMSATVNAARFAEYFASKSAAIKKPPAVHRLSIPGRTFPIDDFFLEDAVEATGYVARGKMLLRGEEAEEELAPLMQAQAELSDKGGEEGGEEGEGAESAAYSARTRAALQKLPPGIVPADLVAMLLSKLDADADSDGSERGAVLIFMPGVPEIRKLSNELARSAGAARWLLLPLHGELPAGEQRKVFGPPPRGLRKVIISTNVAETSLTIDDVTVVIDSGRVKQSSYDALNAAAQLVETWAPRSSRRQRRGRAGRTRQGQYYALYSRAQERRLPDEAPPEILRVPLENIYLQIMAMGFAGGDARAFLSKALQPPPPVALDAASLALRRVGALVGGSATQPLPPPQKLDSKAEAKVGKWVAAKKARDFETADKLRAELKKAGVDAQAAAESLAAAAAGGKVDGAADVSADVSVTREELTPLGQHLARMPLDARIGKILIYGALLGCLEPALTIAAAMSLSRSPFLSPMDRRQEAQQARKPFCTERSDHMALLRAYEGWAGELHAGGGGAARRYAESHFLSYNGMEELNGTRRTLAGALADIGFSTSPARQPLAEASSGNSAEGHTNIVRALLCAGLYPNIARIRMPETKYMATPQGAVETANEEARAVKFFEIGGSRVFLHPTCVLFGESAFEHARWLTFTSKQRVGGPPPSLHESQPTPTQPAGSGGGGDQGKTYVRDVSAVSPLALLLFGGDVQVHHDKGTVTIDREITFEAPGRVAVLVRELRVSLDKLLSDKIAQPSLEIASHPVLAAIVNLITTERAGFS